MSSTDSLTVRKLNVNLKKGFDRHWNGGDAFLSAMFNALSMSFPFGEQFFIDAVRAGEKNLGNNAIDQAMRTHIKDFIAQEATHRFLHTQYNDQLAQQGFHNTWEIRALAQSEKLKQRIKDSPHAHLHELGLTAAYEHITAVLGYEVMLSVNKPHDWLQHADIQLQTLWRWHAAEEMEHRAIAFDLYTHLGGNYRRRVFWFAFALLRFSLDLTRQTTRNLWDDKTLHLPSTWWSAFKFTFGKYGFIRRLTLPLLAYCKRDFHPKHHGDDALLSQWLHLNQSSWQRVG